MSYLDKLKPVTAVSQQQGGVAKAGSDYLSKLQPVTAPQEKKRGVFGKVAHFLAPTATEVFTGEKELNLRTGLGAALELGSFAIPVGGIAKGAGLAAKGLGLAAKGLGKRALESAAIGAAAGGVQQAGTAIGEGEDIGGVARRAAGGAVGGAVVGGLIPPAFAGVARAGRAVPPLVSGGLERIGIKTPSVVAREASEAALLKAKTPEASIATKTLTPEGKVVTDPIAEEVIKQGVGEADVALVKMANEADKAKMRKMLSIRESQFRNKRVVDRATDVAGDTFLEKVAKPLQATNRQAAKDLDVVAQGLAGRKVDVSSALTKFGDELEKAGIKTRADGKLNFKGSDFEGLKSVQNSISNVWNRAIRIAKTGDALQLHRAKRYIDNIVEFGTEGQGLTGNAERILKGFRRNADQVLDVKFPAYNKANTIFSETIGELNKLAQVMGKRFRISDEFADAQAGLTLRRIMSNTKSRSEILQLLESAQNVAKKYGAKIDEDVINQVAFADTLEKALGSEAGTSFLGGIERGMERAQDIAGIMEAYARGGIVRGTARTAQFLSDLAKGVNQQNKIKALKALLGEGGEAVAKKPTVFGRKPPIGGAGVTAKLPKGSPEPLTKELIEEAKLHRAKADQFRNNDLEKEFVARQLGVAEGLEKADDILKSQKLRPKGPGAAATPETAAKIAGKRSVPNIKTPIIPDEFGNYDRKAFDAYLDSIPGDTIPVTHETTKDVANKIIKGEKINEDIFASLGFREVPEFTAPAGKGAVRILIEIPKKEVSADVSKFGQKYFIGLDTMDHGKHFPFKGQGGHISTPAENRWIKDIIDSKGNSLIGK